ncbi:VWA domain-containing protein [Pelagibius sp. 7325]|uniref:nitric oxide reductase activation protein NorD n=1 Tax=Pelagibius sp. 7325 TaxID=3131994 RepID=UPI0030EE0D7C
MAEDSKPFLKLVSDEDSTTMQQDKGLQMLFPEPYMAPWLRACRRIEGAGYGEAVTRAYERHGIACAQAIGPDAAIDLADAVSAVAIKSGRKAAETLCEAAAMTARRLGELPRFRNWLSLMQRFAAMAPESAWVVLQRMKFLLGQLNVSALESWLLAGVRLAGGDSERRYAFFTMENPDAERWLLREAGDLVFADVERRMKAYLAALFGIRVPMVEPSASAPEASRRRSSFGAGIIRLPQSYPGYRGQRCEDVFRAALAHAGAHMTYGGPRYPIGQLKPLQVSLVSLIEDARVERLAMRDFPGLARLWLPFHIAQASGAETAPSLFARLSRALIDPDFHDPSAWVRKGREMFNDLGGELDNPAMSRHIGNLLGNDLGQMRVQFNAKTYVVEPPYRDDNMGLWDFGEENTVDEEVEVVLDSARLEQRDDQEPDREREEEEEEPQDDSESAPLARETLADQGIPVARYPEFDYQTGRERSEWTTVVEYDPPAGAPQLVPRILERHAALANRISGLIRSARVSRAQRLKRQPDGEALDLDACIEAAVSLRRGEMPDTRVYQRMERRQRDLAVQVVLDVSQSTADQVPGSGSTILDLEREATVLLAHAMAELGDPFAISAFCSNGREEVRYTRIKEFERSFATEAHARLAGLAPAYSTRMGAALRHAAADLQRQRSYRRLVLLLTDGEPSDVDCPERRYLIEDARRAIHGLAARGIDVFCVALGRGHEEALNRVFGRRNLLHIDRIERLPEKLPLLYMRLTA